MIARRTRVAPAAAWIARWVDDNRRLSEELHDEVAPVVAALAYAGEGHARGEKTLEVVREAADRLNAWIESARERNFVTAVEKLGLEDAIEWLLARTEQRVGATLRLRRGLPGRAAMPEHFAAFGAFQDLLALIVVSAEQRGTVSLSQDGDTLCIELAVDTERELGSADISALPWCELVSNLGGHIEVTRRAQAVLTVDLTLRIPRESAVEGPRDGTAR